ncbi:MAG: hypothetical protein ACSLE6_07325 [Mycobacterium sp.]
MNTTTTATHPHRARGAALAAAGVVTVLALASACGGSTGPGAGTGISGAQRSAGNQSAGAVLPVTENPIANTSTAQSMVIDSVLVENNVDASGKAVDDHLEIAIINAGTTELTGFEVYYTITDPQTSDTESYYADLPDDFAVAGGGSRVIHFDNTGATDHFPVNQYSLYYTDTNALDLTVEVSATESAPQTASVTKDAGGAEEAD